MPNHFVFPAHGEGRKFKTPREGRTVMVPVRADPRKHSFAVRQAFRAAFEEADARLARLRPDTKPEQLGLFSYIDILAHEPSFDPARYEDRKAGIQVMSVHQASKTDMAATVFVPNAARPNFFRKLDEYNKEKLMKDGVRKNRPFVDSIDSVVASTARSFWTEPDDFPEGNESRWWEVWFATSAYPSAFVPAIELGVLLSDDELDLGERRVRLARGTPEQIDRFVTTVRGVAEIRKPREARFPYARGTATHSDVARDLGTRLNYVASDAVVCVLDTGVNANHDLLRSSVSLAASIEPLREADDHGHGSGMAGLALLGDLWEAHASSGTIDLMHRIESVNISVKSGKTITEEARKFYAGVMDMAMAKAETHDPDAARVYCLALTMERTDGAASAWSTEVDRKAFDANRPRLIVVSGGNLVDDAGHPITQLETSKYPGYNYTANIHDPGQAWNALTVGGYTSLCALSPHGPHAGHTPLASAGDLSPYASTSLLWNPKATPIKPDVVLEAGNMAYAAGGIAQSSDDLEMLSTDRDQSDLQAFAQTSGATALAARLAARIWSRYPNLRPETVRALIVHSAEWTEAMKGTWGPKKAELVRGLRVIGYGVPNERRALESGNDSATIICESQFQPFGKPSGGGKWVGAGMVVHDLPWPTSLLEQLENEQVEIRVTLSYFIEPQAGTRTGGTKYVYESHALKFAMKRSKETDKQFLDRITADARDEESTKSVGEDNWHFGIGRERGSIQSDYAIERGTNAAKRGRIAIYPAGRGWWKDNPDMKRSEARTNYSLVVSLRPVARAEIDNLYGAIAEQAAGVLLQQQSEIIT